MSALLNLVRVASATVGTGALTLGSAVSGFLTAAQAGGVDGTEYAYAIEADFVGGAATSREQGVGTLGGSGTTLTRSVTNSTNGDALLNLAGDAQVIITPRRQDLVTTDANGRVTIADTFPLANISIDSFPSRLQVVAPGGTDWHYTAVAYGNDNNAPGLGFAKTRATTQSGHAIVHSGDPLMVIAAYGSNGSVYVPAAAIWAAVDDIPGLTPSDMPGRLSFYTTPNNSNALVERLRITNSGLITTNVSNGGINVYDDNTQINADVWPDAGRINIARQNYRSVFQAAFYANDNVGVRLVGGKSRGATLGTQTVVQQNDELLRLEAWGVNGASSWNRAGWLAFECDGTSGGGSDMPGRITLWTTPDGSGNPVEAVRIDSTQYMLGKSSGVYPEEQYTCLSSDFAGSNATGAQPFFSASQDAFTADASTTYIFEAVLILSKSAGTTSHTIAIGFGGTAAFTNIDYLAIIQFNLGALVNTTGTVGLMNFMKTASSTVQTSAITSATSHTVMHLRGVMRVSTGGTIIPQYTLSSAPGGAYSTQRGSYFRMKRIGTDSAAVRGAWA